MPLSQDAVEDRTADSEQRTVASRAPALRMVHRYFTSSGALILDLVALRRPEFLLRFTKHGNIVVDERLLTTVHPFKAARSRMVAVIMLRGELDIDDEGTSLHVGPGEAVLMSIPSMQRTRWQRTAYIDLEWAPDDEVVGRDKPTRLTTPDRTRVERLAAALADDSSDQRSTLAAGFDLFSSIGAPIRLSVDALVGGPTARDRRLARAIEEQLAHLSSRATTLDIGEAMNLSQRQVHRLVEEFNARYGINAGSWRDTRNRWRVQFAAILLSAPDATVAEVAKEVGYASPNALARAFATAGFPAPAIVRQRMSGNDLR